MAKNINIPQKNTGDTRTAAEDNLVTNWANEPMKSFGAFNIAMTFDSQGQYDDYVQTGAIELTATSIVPFNVQVVRITADGINDITFGAGIDKVITQFTNPLPAGAYWFYMASFVSPGGSGSGVHISIPETQAVILPAPVLNTITIENVNPDDVVMVFDGVVTGTNLGFTINGTTSTTFASISGSGTNTITGVLAVAAVFGETITLDYSSVTGDIVGQNLIALETISGAAVTNNVASVTAPVVFSMTVEDGAKNSLIVTFDSSCTFTNVGYTFRVDSTPRTLTAVSGAPGTVATFTIDGAAIATGEVLDLAYDSGTGDTIKQSNSVELVTFTATFVTNNIDITGLVAQYLADNNTLDTSGNGYDGIGTDITYGPDRNSVANSSFILNGTTSFINIDAALAGLATNTKGTFSVWAKPVTGLTGSSHKMIAFGDTDADEFLEINQYVLADVRVAIRDATVNELFVNSFNPYFADNTWVHVAFVQDGAGNPLIYVDGASVTLDFVIDNDRNKWFNDLTGLDNGRIGCYQIAGGLNDFFFNGSLDDIRIYDRDLSAAEILALYNE